MILISSAEQVNYKTEKNFTSKISLTTVKFMTLLDWPELLLLPPFKGRNHFEFKYINHSMTKEHVLIGFLSFVFQSLMITFKGMIGCISG